MERQSSSSEVPEPLLARIRQLQATDWIRRRAVFARGGDRWHLVCCTVEVPASGPAPGTPGIVHRYQDVLLFEDSLSKEECIAFALKVHEGNPKIGDIELQMTHQGQWSSEIHPFENSSMRRAGWTFSARAASNSHPTPRKLLKLGLPYFPDLDAAAREWLPFPVYHGHSDGRNQQIHFLAIEDRAFFSSWAYSEDGLLDAHIRGSRVDHQAFFLKGAFGTAKGSRQFEIEFQSARCQLRVDQDCEWLECFLLDKAGEVFDHHLEDRYSRASGRSVLNAGVLGSAEVVLEAAERGEGETIEFKPFMRIETTKRATDRDTKFGEIARTVAAFSNSAGGRILLGVEDDCSIKGIDQDLQRELGAAVSRSEVEKYCGALKNKIKECIRGEIEVLAQAIPVGGVHVVMVTVSRARLRPVSPQDDMHVYVRRGASNRKLPPELWRTVNQSGALAEGEIQ